MQIGAGSLGVANANMGFTLTISAAPMAPAALPP